jgi:catechol 2,3-dioxygenase-like lactoylglutathione lyase family enzyme
MIAGGTVTIYVSDMERSIRFYTETLGLKLMYRGGPGYAAIDGGKGLELGLHGAHPGSPVAGSGKSVQVGFYLDEPIGQVVETLRSRGVEVDGPKSGGGPITLAHFVDPDGTPLYVCEIAR